jgi:addiction module HigA family antidote
MMRMHNPPHPGEVLKDTVLRKDGGLSVTEFAKRLGVSRVALLRVVNGRAAVSSELAIRLAAPLGGSAEVFSRFAANAPPSSPSHEAPRLVFHALLPVCALGGGS